MRVATFRSGGDERLGVVRDEEIVDVALAAARLGVGDLAGAASGMLALIAGGDEALRALADVVARAPGESILPLTSVELLAPIPRPRKNVFCVGRNYAEHAAESLRAIGQEVKLPLSPNIFTKAVTAVTGPYSNIPFDASVSERIDWEVELAVIVGPGGRRIARDVGMKHVWGYTVLNDVSARDIQNRPGVQWFLGKSLDGSCPMGPWIVTADELPDPTDVRLRLLVNGVVKQEDTTAHMLFDIPALLAEISHGTTLEPGDIIATGTPAGVGFARTPPEFLRPGDVMESVIEGIGALRNRFMAV
ncbi:MAG TPA: fumarylacetoacetate hydrolase family protein, partial [Ktedonobacterales bacterium]|nr:fumarylacetoacetate hydrolase family protein [Ktedonobacterales bacterium]